MTEDNKISDIEANGERDAPLDAELKAERQAREAADREILALKTEKQALEYRVINANRTLAYGLGRALIEARSMKGLVSLPGKIRRLRSKQRAKRRERVPNSFDDNVAAQLRLVEPALERAGEQGADAAAQWVAAERAEPRARARALAEIAHWVLDRDPDSAAAIAGEAAMADPSEGRLFPLAQRLRQAGLVRAPAALCAAIGDRQSLSELQRRQCERMIEDGAIIEAGAWQVPESGGDRSASGRAGMTLLCPERRQSLAWVEEIRQAATDAGFDIAQASAADTDFGNAAIVHIVAASLWDCCDLAVAARSHGCRVIVDIANPPDWLVQSTDSEMAAVAMARLKGLAGAAERLVVRSQAMADLASRLGLAHDAIAAGTADTAIDPAHQAAALVEYGVQADTDRIGIAASLSDDPGLGSALEAIAALPAPRPAILIFGTGDRRSAHAERAESLGIAGEVHFLGLPPPQRWPALMGGMKLMLVPPEGVEPMGSEIPELLKQACAEGCPVLASGSAWASQLEWQPESAGHVPEEGDWTEAVQVALHNRPPQPQRTQSGASVADLYKTLSNKAE